MVDVNSIRSGSLIFAQFWSYLLICLGTFGHLLNIYVFTRRKLRSNPCVRYFLASTLSGLFVTYINIALRLLQIVYKIDAFGYSFASCKILSCLVFWAKYLKCFFWKYCWTYNPYSFFVLELKHLGLLLSPLLIGK